jgi:DNA-binding transcriptional LysR family regulator
MNGQKLKFIPIDPMIAPEKLRTLNTEKSNIGWQFLFSAKRNVAKQIVVTDRIIVIQAMGRSDPSVMKYVRPSTERDVSVSTYPDLRAKVDSCELDLAVVMSDSHKDGAVLRDAQFVWVASEKFELAEGSSVPLALSPAPCVNREVGLTALEQTPVEWHIVFTSLSQQGLRAAVSAGLAVTVLTSEELEPGMRIVDGEYGLPKLPATYFTLLWSATGKTPAATEFGRILLDLNMPRESG